MTSHLYALSLAAVDPLALGRFWSGLLGWAIVPEVGGAVAVVPEEAAAYRLRFVGGAGPKVGPNRIHLDLTIDDRAQDDTVARALELGARHLDIGQGPDEEHVVLADPEGNELCVIEPGNGFLAGCGQVGAINCEGTREVGLFWSAALGWPLVWDQDEETAIQSSHGGTKMTWSGPPVPPQTGRARQHLDLVLPSGEDLHAELDRLAALGATRVDVDGCDPAWTVLADPDGNELCVAGSTAGLVWRAEEVLAAVRAVSAARHEFGWSFERADLEGDAVLVVFRFRDRLCGVHYPLDDLPLGPSTGIPAGTPAEWAFEVDMDIDEHLNDTLAGNRFGWREQGVRADGIVLLGPH